ncbi:5-formyltetrahydrofolate cyclo-ligase [Bermanella marisrubri]|nr:5-formyltetrahydrofolate cyclo-ligase [Bermanella marisrubri]QIZ85595.1 5-formyltetrahydrofolate cyclo-ligase [Bermanella marisrubri]
MSIQQDSTQPIDRQLIRQAMRGKRQSLSDQQQLKHAKAIAKHAMSANFFTRAQTIAIYLANDGEANPVVLAEKSLYRGKQCVLPILHPTKKGFLQFADYRLPRKKNKFGIEEPISREFVKAQQLDLVFMPLVAFDQQGGRLGMGGGFYDRSFEFLRHSTLPKPKLIGLAHSFQQVESLPIEEWDVPMHAIVTEKGLIEF